MHYRKAITLFVVLLTAGLCCHSVRASESELPWNERIGTIAWARTLPLGTHVLLDAEDIVKIRAHDPTPYILIAEPFSGKDRLIVFTNVSPMLRLGQICDIEGSTTVTTSGDFAIQNATIWGYADSAGNLLYNGPLIKGLLERTPWDWMVDLTVRSETQSARSAAAATPGEPNTNLSAGPTFYPTVTDIISPSTSQTQSARTQSYYPGVPSQGLYDGALIALECKPIDSAGVQTINSHTYNYIDIQDDGGTTTLRAYCLNAVTDTRLNLISGQMRTDGSGGWWLCVDDGSGYDPQVYVGQLQTVAANTIAFGYTLPDSAAVSLTGKIVEANSSEFPGAFYIQEPSRVSGIRVIYTGASLSRGDVVSVSGTMATGADGEREIQASSVSSESGEGSPSSLGMPNRTLGGSDFNVYTYGVDYPTGSGIGLFNKGLLVKIWGLVTAVNTSDFHMDDGSGLQDGLGNPGVKVSWAWPTSGKPALTPPTVGSYVSATGISSSEWAGSYGLRRVLRPRDQGDISTYSVRLMFGSFAASQCIAGVGDTVTITFSASKELSGSPTVTVNGNATTTPTNQGLNYTCQYTVQSGDTPGNATIQVTGTDLDDNEASTSNSNVLSIASAPTVTAPTGTIGDLAPVVAWSISGTYDRYQVQLVNTVDSNDNWDSGEVISTDLFAQVTRLLTNNATYSVKVRTGRPCGWGQWSQLVQFTLVFTEPPLPLTVPYCTQQ